MNSQSDPVSMRGDAAPAEKQEARTDRTQGVAAALRLFASIFQREVDEALLTEIQAREQELALALGGDPLTGLDIRDPHAAVEVLAAEYCRLFIGPRQHLPPVESVVLGEGRFWGPSTEAVSEFYQSVGVKPSEDSHVLPDHISMELDCLGVLEETGRHDKAAGFAREHILRWGPRLIRHIEENASIAFYSIWGKALLTTLEELYN